MTQQKRHKNHRKTSRAGSRKKKGWLARFRVLLPHWTLWVGAAVAVVGCWQLIRLLTAVPTDYPLPTGYSVHGIDVSHHQGRIDWELLCNRATIDGQPLSFVMMKATEGATLLDSRFRHNFDKARQFGFTRGVYHFYSTLAPAAEQAQFFIRNVQLQPGDLPPVLDVEVKPKGQSKAEFRQGVLLWLQTVEAHYGVRPILYTYHRFRIDYLADTVFNRYPFWIAHYYVDSLRYRGPWTFWQHTDRGRLPGIKEAVDLDVFNGSFSDLRQMTIPER